MDTNKLKEIGTRVMVEHFDNPDILNECCIPEVIVHWSWGEQSTAEEVILWLKNRIKENLGATRIVVDDCFAEGDKVAIRYRTFFPHKAGGDIMRDENAIMCFQGERIAEVWVAFDRRFEEEQEKLLDSQMSL
jgi:hypothetical protein